MEELTTARTSAELSSPDDGYCLKQGLFKRKRPTSGIAMVIPGGQVEVPEISRSGRPVQPQSARCASTQST